MPKLIVRRITGETYPIDIESSSTVQQLKAKIQAVSNIDIAHQTLYSDDEMLEDEDCLEDYSFIQGEVISLSINLSTILTIAKADGSRATEKFPDCERTTIRYLRDTVVQLYDGETNCTLIYNSTQLEDTGKDGKDKTFADYGLRHNSHVEVSVATKGGEFGLYTYMYDNFLSHSLLIQQRV